MIGRLEQSNPPLSQSQALKRRSLSALSYIVRPCVLLGCSGFPCLRVRYTTADSRQGPQPFQPESHLGHKHPDSDHPQGWPYPLSLDVINALRGNRRHRTYSPPSYPTYTAVGRKGEDRQPWLPSCLMPCLVFQLSVVYLISPILRVMSPIIDDRPVVTAESVDGPADPELSKPSTPSLLISTRDSPIETHPSCITRQQT
ncbi:hypothetical protein B0H65DRAFT_221625 [Neurospora tetraspora]|uniref:Uncharacterized protein n=1 Tax=Neurospora tetraspora TaxID=94610 RepID=A0AAE0JCY7_9PEZI|nr:hypothetical protein B0H65DRAFT_221625 [Neurospora tetraspora]